MIRTDYRFTLTRDTDTFEVFPEGFFAGSFKYEQEEGQLFFRKHYNGKLSFRGYDYNYIKDRYDLGYYCDIYELLIEKYDKDISNYVVDWTGYFSMTDGDFDFERCRFSVEPTLQDKYSCILRNWETEYNLLKIGFNNIVSKTTTFFAFQLIGAEAEADFPATQLFDPFAGYSIGYFTHNLIYTEYKPHPVVATEKWWGLYACEGKYVKIGETPSGSGWTLNATKGDYDIYLRTFLPYNTLPNVDDIYIVIPTCNTANWYECTARTPADDNEEGVWVFASKASQVTAYAKSSFFSGRNIDDDNTFTYLGRLLNEAILFLLNKTCTGFSNSSLVSEFLTNATNPVTGLSSKTNNIHLIQKSDAKRPGASNPATEGNMSFRQLMESLYNTAQLYWFIDDNFNINIVHQSEIGVTAGINITSNPYILTTAHKKQIEFNKELLFRYEKWSFAEANGLDFVGKNIEYDENCTIKDNDAKTKTYDIPYITTDLGFIQNNIDDISDDGFCLVACDGSLNIINEVGSYTGSSQINGHLSLANLHYNYWRHNRILSTGLMNGVQTNFLTTQKIRKLSEQQIKYCGDFDPLDTVTTELGSAIVNEAEFFPLDNKLVLNMSI